MFTYHGKTFLIGYDIHTYLNFVVQDLLNDPPDYLINPVR